MEHPYPEGTRVAKVQSEPGDAHPNGSLGRIVLVAPQVPEMRGQWAYFVEYDDHKGLPIGTMGYKLKPIISS